MKLSRKDLEILRLALRNAIDWQKDLAEAWHGNTPQAKECLKVAGIYHGLLERVLAERAKS